MIHDLIENFLLGFAITALPGAVFFETIRRSLANNASVYKFLAGTLAGMSIIIASVFLGLSSVFSNKSTNSIFYVLTGLVLMYIGLTSLLSKSVDSTSKQTSNSRLSSATLTGLILSLANPISIIFWISVIGKMLQKRDSLTYALLNSFSVVAGALCLFGIVIMITSFAHSVFKPKNVVIMSRFFGLLLFVYGLFNLNKAL